MAGAEHADKNPRQNPPRRQGSREPALEQILHAIGEQTALGMLAEDVAVPPEGKGRAERSVHKHMRGIGLLPLARPPDRKAKLPGLDAEGVSCLGVRDAHDLMHDQRPRGDEMDVLRVLMKGIQGFRSGCDGGRYFKNKWFHGKKCA